MGPVDFEELRGLVAAGSITPTTWVHHPMIGSWVAASTIPELMEALPRTPVGAPPDAAPPTLAYCRFCGAAASPSATHCGACGRPMQPAIGSGIDARTAVIVCRASILASAVMPILSVLGPIVVWAIGSSDPAIVREAKASINCHLTMLIAAFCAFVVGVVGIVILIGPLITVIAGLAIFVYAIVVGIRGLIAAANDQPFAYPFVLPLFK